MADASETWQAVHPEGFARSIIAVTILFTITTWIIIGLRMYIRVATNANMLEDYLMYSAGVLNTVHNALVIAACYTGLGTREAELTATQSIEAAKMITLWQIFYITLSPFVKISICVNIIRISTLRRYRYPLFLASGLSIAMTIMGLIVVFIQCVPFSASWNGQGKCISVNVIIIPTYVFSSVNIYIDWVVAILPAFLVWNLQMRLKLKLLCYFVLAVGVFASIATIIRMPYISAYSTTEDKLYKVGNIILWTVIELSVGILAGSLPSLRKLFKSLASDHSSAECTYENELQTFGGTGNKRHIIPDNPYDCDLNVTVQASRKNRDRKREENIIEHEQEDDDDSARRIINVTREYKQESTVKEV